MPSPDQERLARILDDYLVAIERGLPVNTEELIAQYPEDAEQLRGYLSGLQLFHAAAGAAAPQIDGSIIGGPLPQPSQTLGDYRLVREIGRGGMGVVYEAWQLSLRRRVALKILPFTVANDAKQLSRFKNEAQAAAQVQHPNIVPVYAVGQENGVHFYVMQLVEGQSLTSLLEGLRSNGHQQDGGTTAPNYPDLTIAWPEKHGSTRPGSSCAANQSNIGVALPMRASETADHIRVVARLAKQAALALHAAHEYGVVHRDIKPSNLLLDDQGKLWVTDFGLARCRQQQGLTQTGDVLGTMRYMSPEQALGRAALIDQRTDIYSLGITMYELATLHHPADGAGDLQLYFDRQREAPKPLREWNRHIAADFQTIVLKCLAEFPHERYSTARELADDCERFLEGRPIEACPPTLLSRATKWAKRRRATVASAAVILVFAIGGAIASMLMLAHERNLASQRVIEQTKQVAGDSWESLNPAKWADQLAAIPGAEGVRHEMLRAGLEFYQRYQKVADDPALGADWALAQIQLGLLNEKLDNKQAAIKALSEAVQVWEDRIARDPSNTKNVRKLAMARNNLGAILQQDGRSNQALDVLIKARDAQASLSRAEPQLRELSVELLATETNIGRVLMQKKDKLPAIKSLSDAIRIGQPLADEPDANEDVLRNLAANFNNLAALQHIGQPIVAAEAYRNAIAIERRLVKANPINRTFQGDLARTYSNYGNLSSRNNNWANAEVCYRDAIQIQQNLVKASPMAGIYRRDLAISYNNLGMAQIRGARLAEAEQSFRNAAALQENLLAAQPKDAETRSNHGSVWNNLGMLLDRRKNYELAENSYRKAIASQRMALEAAPKNDRYRSLLSAHYSRLVWNLDKQAKYGAAVEAAIARKKLWAGNADRLYAVAQQLANTYDLMRATSTDQRSQKGCVTAAVETLRDAVAAGLPADRLKDKSLSGLAGIREIQKLVDNRSQLSRTN
jgi:serine/threonine protein kinase/tetratricopeptide (TPR) repeat protein